jgi:HKD family nuclease
MKLICWSFIKWKGIRILERELREFTERRKLRVITTTYIGATDAKAVEFYPLKKYRSLSYNTGNERLYAKSLFVSKKNRFHTGYIVLFLVLH